MSIELSSRENRVVVFVDAILASICDRTHADLSMVIEKMLPVPKETAQILLFIITWMCLRAVDDSVVEPPHRSAALLAECSRDEIRRAYEAIAHVGMTVAHLEQCAQCEGEEHLLLRRWSAEDETKHVERCKQWFAADEERARCQRVLINTARALAAYRTLQRNAHTAPLLAMTEEELRRQPPRFWTEISLDSVEDPVEQAAIVCLVRSYTTRHGRSSTCLQLQKRCADWINYNEIACDLRRATGKRVRIAPFSSVEMQNYLQTRKSSAGDAGGRPPDCRSSSERYSHWALRRLSGIARRRPALPTLV
jgi:hypothetical protein